MECVQTLGWQGPWRSPFGSHRLIGRHPPHLRLCFLSHLFTSDPILVSSNPNLGGIMNSGFFPILISCQWTFSSLSASFLNCGIKKQACQLGHDQGRQGSRNVASSVPAATAQGCLGFLGQCVIVNLGHLNHQAFAK